MKIKRCIICKGKPLDGLPYCDSDECISKYIDLVRIHGLDYVKKNYKK